MSLTLPNSSIDEDIYKGFWINWSLGRFRGATLTLDHEAGGLIVSFLALFIVVTGRSLWKITRFLVHVTESIPSKQDGVYHQRQAILRNQPLALNAVLDLLRLSYVWRNRAERTPQRTLPVTLAASAIYIASVIAGILSSRIVTGSNNEVLIIGQKCGAYRSIFDDDISLATSPSLMLYHTRKAIDAITYATQCYHTNDTARNEICNIFATTTLPFRTERNATCPFSESICESVTGNLLLYSGDLDSHSQLGLNQGPHFTLRDQTHCAPLKTTGFTEVISVPNRTEHRRVYRYGKRVGLTGADTYVFSVEVREEKPLLDGITSGNYKVSVLKPDHELDGIELIPDLNVANGSVSLIFLDKSEIIYSNKTQDPWFSASSLLGDYSTDSNASDPEFFVAGEPVGVLGCVAQRFYCNPSLPKDVGCVETFSLSRSDQNSSELLEKAWPDMNDQLAMRAFIAILGGSGAGSLDSFFALPNVPALLSRNTVISNLQTAALPNDQWQDEREYLYKASLAAIQSTMVEHARGLTSLADLFCNEGKGCRRICHSQKIRSSKHYSFSGWVLCVMMVIGGTLILISTFVEELFAIILRDPRFRSPKLIYSYVEWQAGSTLQLQRLANENLGLGAWTRTDEAVPITEPGDTLAVLDIVNPKHARMVVPTEELGIIDTTKRLRIKKITVGYSTLGSTAST